MIHNRFKPLVAVAMLVFSAATLADAPPDEVFVPKAKAQAAKKAVKSVAEPEIRLPGLKPTMACDPIELQVSAKGSTSFQLTCHGSSASEDTFILAPEVLVYGGLGPQATAPYRLQARYVVDARMPWDKATGQMADLAEVGAGVVTGWVDGVSELHGFMAKRLHWDSLRGIFSIQEDDSLWRIFVRDENNNEFVMAGVADGPVIEGKGHHDVMLTSAFASAPATARTLLAFEDGKLQVQVGPTRLFNKERLVEAIKRLDKKPADIGRAWTVAALAQYLGLQDERLYAEQKVATHNPHQLHRFSAAVDKIESFADSE